jgi:sarcosine oxidase subunit alpha
MTGRLPQGGQLINRNDQLKFRFNGTELRGHPGDTLASALLANGQLVMGRSFKYHRPRGIVASGAEEPNALMALGEKRTLEPNQRATTTELFDGLIAKTQNHWPSLEFDVGAINAKLSRFLPAGFYYKMFMWPRSFWKHVYEPFIRQSAGLGPAPKTRDRDRYEHFNITVDLVVIGGGIAGLEAAKRAGEAGAEVLLLEQTPYLGGRGLVDGGEIDGMAARDWIAQTMVDLEAMDNVHIRTRTMGAGIYDHGYLLGYERLGDHLMEDTGPRHRLWRIRAGHIITATGAIERPLSFAGNDVPGVMLASAVRDYVVNFGVDTGKRTVICTNNDDGYRTALALHAAGLETLAVVDARPIASSRLIEEVRALGIRVEQGRGIAKVVGQGKVEGIKICDQSGDGGAVQEIKCDTVAMSGGWSPVVHLWSHCGGKLIWDDAQSHFRPDPERPPLGATGAGFVTTAGMASGAVETDDVLADAFAASAHALKALGFGAVTGSPTPATPENAAPPEPVWVMPANAGKSLRSKMWLDFQNDVKVSDVQLAAQEGFESVEHTKRYTTLGMATDQGKLSNINGLAILSDALGAPIPAVGTTTFRPPYTPISMGAIAGEARGKTFQPVRKTPIHDWHEANGAHWEPVGHWRRPYCFLRDDETVGDAVKREVLNTREGVGLLDASTLGKIIVKGPNAGQFLDMIHAHMEEWLQTEWWDWQVYTANVTEQYAQIAVVGPDARDLLEDLGGMDVSAEALPFMTWTAGQLGGFDARVFRISFSGELSYEIAVPAGQGRAFWDKLLELGAEMNVMPYGTEALHIMRAEKGFIMIGDETDGTVIPQDLGLHWALSKKKDDYLGKRAQERSHMTDPDRWKLVGLETLDGGVLPDGAYAVAEGENENGQRNMIGRVTSTYYSPTLGKGIAMGLVLHGPNRMGDVIEFPVIDGPSMRARIVDPVFYDKEGAKQNV